MEEHTIVKTEIQGIQASVLLAYLEAFEVRISAIQDAFKPEPETVLITRQQVADYIGVSLPTLHAWTKNGTLKAYRIGNKVRYKKNEILEALQVIYQK
jgi:excisionase family DNA binding protein